ncbi:hypothetical protein G4V62_17485 [Bacillaceae bacterium SIJ1]|uniref:hypothetical protein n=1 Tax=Litoribacterium kuwaitense TaxID=1398745 RepID=UPI0013ED2C37|nr:hypothetical protein [Litoribacterium kuwaitense]NGP46649.1 hypothetical protein [Litoribacterium kuwaitense]
MNNNVPFNVYGIGINHPRDWQIIVNPNKTFTFNEGFVKIDHMTKGKTAAASLAIRWAMMKDDIAVDDYVLELEKEFKKNEKKSRNKERYRLVDKTKIHLNGNDAFILENECISNHSLYRMFGKDERLTVLQCMFYSQETKRMIVASITTHGKVLIKDKDFYLQILHSLHETLTDSSVKSQQTKIS